MALLFLSVLPAGWCRDYQVRDWQVENGLPDSTVTALAQTSDGYLWVGTRKGLACFDGDSFRRVDSGSTNSPEDSCIIGLQAGSQGDLWIVSQSGLVTRLVDGKFTVEHPPGGTYVTGPAMERLSIQNWRAWKATIARDATGDIWALADQNQIVRFSPTGENLPVSTDGLPPGDVRGLARDAGGRIWLLIGTNVCIYTGNHWAYSTNFSVPLLSQFIGPAGEDGIYLSKVSDSLAFVEILDYRPDGSWTSTPEPVPTTPANPQAMAMLPEANGQLWLGERWGGVCFKPPGGDWTRLPDAGLVARCSASCFLKDRQNNLWVGTFEEGLIKVYEPPVKIVMLPPEKIAADLHITTVNAAHDGGFWAGTDTGLYHGTYEGAPRLDAVPELNGESVYSVLEDSRTNLWVGTLSGLFCRSTNGFQKLFNLPPTSGGILALYEARNGSIWAAGPRGHLLYCPAGKNPPAVKPIECKKGAARLCCITEDLQGRIWVGSGNMGLWRVRGHTLVQDGPSIEALGTSIRSLLFDSDGVLWIGTWADGLFRWGNYKLQNYTTEDGLPDDVILGLATDSLDNLWMISHDGIIGVSRRQFADYVRGKSAPLLCQHLRLNEDLRICSGAGQPVISTLHGNWFWAATMLGVTGYNPKILAETKTGTEARIESLKADNVVIQPNAGGFRVPSETRRFEFQYSVPELDMPENLHFRHRLEGLDPDWIDAGSARSAVYSQLPPGHYKFRVMVGGTDGVWREIKTPAQLQVIPRIWQTIWFRALAIVTVILALAGMGIWNERRKIRRRMERLEARQAVERMRQRIARDLHDELGSTITGIIQHGDMVLRVEPEPGQLRTTIGDMSGRLRQLSVALDEIVWTMNSRNDTLPNLVGYITNHAQEYLRPAGIRCRLDVATNLPHTAVDSQTRHNLFLAVKEAIHNAARHSGAIEVMLRVHFEADCLRISVEDNGCGFDASAISPGEGLANLRERLTAVQGSVEISSEPGAGTKVIFSVNLNQMMVPG